MSGSEDLDVCEDHSQQLAPFLVPFVTGSADIRSATADSGGFHPPLANSPGAHFTVLAATNVAAPLTEWTVVDDTSEVIRASISLVIPGGEPHAALLSHPFTEIHSHSNGASRQPCAPDS